MRRKHLLRALRRVQSLARKAADAQRRLDRACDDLKVTPSELEALRASPEAYVLVADFREAKVQHVTLSAASEEQKREAREAAERREARRKQKAEERAVELKREQVDRKLAEFKRLQAEIAALTTS